MAEAAENTSGEAEQSGGKKCEECVPGLPLWMGTFSDLVTLLLTFFVLLLSFAKTETSKYKAALGSIRDAFGGNTRVQGEVLVPGKSPDDSPTMIDAEQPVKPFPIEFLTSEGILDKHEINRASEETVKEFKESLRRYDLSKHVNIFEISEGVKMVLKDKIFFSESTTNIIDTNKEIIARVIEMLRDNSYAVYVKGHAAKGERISKTEDAYALSSKRATIISKYLMKEGIRAEKIVTMSFGDARPYFTIDNSLSTKEKRDMSRRVEFTIRKKDLSEQGEPVPSY